MKPIRAVETQLVNALPVASAGSIIVSLHNCPVLSQELEVDLVLRLVALKGGEINVEVETARVTFGALNEGAEGAVEVPRGGAPPSTAAVVEGEGNSIGIGAMGAGFWGIIYGDLLKGLGFRVKSWVSHRCCKRETERRRSKHSDKSVIV